MSATFRPRLQHFGTAHPVQTHYPFPMDGYRNLGAWQSGHELCVETLRALDRAYHPRSDVIFGQLRRAVVSVETHLVAGYTVSTRGMLHHHVQAALAAAAEAQALLNIASELGYLAPSELDRLARTAAYATRGIYALLRSLPGAARAGAVAEPVVALEQGGQQFPARDEGPGTQEKGNGKPEP